MKYIHVPLIKNYLQRISNDYIHNGAAIYKFWKLIIEWQM